MTSIETALISFIFAAALAHKRKNPLKRGSTRTLEQHYEWCWIYDLSAWLGNPPWGLVAV